MHLPVVRVKGSDAQLTSSGWRGTAWWARWEREGKAGLRPRGTCCSAAYSAQSLNPCLLVFLGRLIKERSSAHRTRGTGFGVDERGHPIMLPGGFTLRCADPRARRSWATVNKPVRAHTQSGRVLRFSARPDHRRPRRGESERWLSFTKHLSKPRVCGSDQ